MAKLFKNVNTIFDKIQRGQLEIGESRVFKTIDYYKRPELIKPYLHYIDEERLQKSVDHYMEYDTESYNETVLRNFKNDRKIDKTKLIEDAKHFYQEEFPEELSSDIYNLYYNDPEKLRYEERSDKNKFRYKMLDHLIDPIAKVTTKQSALKSALMTRNMVKYFSLLMAYQAQVDPEAYEDMKNQMKNGGSGDGGQGEGDNPDDQQGDGQPSNGAGSGRGNNPNPKSAEEILEKLMKSEKMEKMQDDFLNQAKQTINQINEVMSDEQADSIFERSDSAEMLSNKFDRHTLNRIKEEHVKAKMNMNKIQNVIKRILDKSTNYFSGKETIEFTSIFDADTLDGLDEYELLHPKIRKIVADEIQVKNIKREGKIDIYIDQSGSMDEQCYFNGVVMTKFEFAKSFAIQMFEMNLIRKIYFFNSSVNTTFNTMFDLLLGDTYGGTDINNVQRSVIEQNVNAIVLTDAEDRCSLYSPKSFFIGVNGARFEYFDSSVMKQLSQNRQVIMFDGQQIFNIDENGKIITE